MAAQPLLRLQRGEVALHPCPQWGGALAGLSHGDRALLRPAGEAFLRHGDLRLAAPFPPVPFPNRLADARFLFLRRVYHLAKNFPPEPDAIHGYGWQHAWAVAEATRSRAELTFCHAVGGTPFDDRARQTFAQRAGTIRLRVV